MVYNFIKIVYRLKNKPKWKKNFFERDQIFILQILIIQNLITNQISSS